MPAAQCLVWSAGSLLVIWPPLETLALQDLKQFVLLVLRRDPVEDEEALTWTRATLHADFWKQPL